MEKPVVVYSSWLQNDYQGVLRQKDYAIYSNSLAQKAGYETVLYTDQASKALLGDIPYNKIIDLDENILNKLPKTVWAAGKILTFSMQSTPFIHLDFDFFILKNDFYEKIKDKDFFVFHEEPWSRRFGFGESFYKHGLQKIFEIFNNNFELDLNTKPMSLNFSIFGSCKNNVIPTIAERSDYIIQNLIKYQNQFDDISFKKHFKKYFGSLSLAMPSVIIEQVILPNIISQVLKSSYYPIIKLKTPKDLGEECKKINLLHLWGLKNREQIKSVVRKHNNYNNNVT
jgi:hypothetical protein